MADFKYKYEGGKLFPKARDYSDFTPGADDEPDVVPQANRLPTPTRKMMMDEGVKESVYNDRREDNSGPRRTEARPKKGKSTSDYASKLGM